MIWRGPRMLSFAEAAACWGSEDLEDPATCKRLHTLRTRSQRPCALSAPHAGQATHLRGSPSSACQNSLCCALCCLASAVLPRVPATRLRPTLPAKLNFGMVDSYSAMRPPPLFVLHAGQHIPEQVANKAHKSKLVLFMSGEVGKGDFLQRASIACATILSNLVACPSLRSSHSHSASPDPQLK